MLSVKQSQQLEVLSVKQLQQLEVLSIKQSQQFEALSADSVKQSQRLDAIIASQKLTIEHYAVLSSSVGRLMYISQWVYCFLNNCL